MIGESLPVPLPGLLASVHVLHNADLALLVAAAHKVSLGARPSDIAPAWRGPASTQEPDLEATLLCYGLMACREVEHRHHAVELNHAPRPSKKDARMAVFFGVQIAQQLLEVHPEACKVGGKHVEIGRIQHFQLQWLEPSWVDLDERCARHRAALLGTRNGRWYALQGWWLQTAISTEGPPDLRLPPNTSDPGVMLLRQRADPCKDWGDPLVKPAYKPRNAPDGRRKRKP